ncbi:hypothetical protein BCR42DRAFT_404185 [Absidia repens]|uniref:Uncharacterized protein n=1 Tax=Absidia repens TaxID=90262 RepID=A0A1X2IVT1_9FUNG|nr:hypothetical protein BCR42DRAFT_404185 [Absidia repens]
MTDKATIPAIEMDIDDDLTTSLDRQINDQSPPLDRLESHSPTLINTSYFGNDTTNSNSNDDRLMSPTITTITKPSMLSNSVPKSNSISSSTSSHYLATQRSYLFALLTCPDMAAYLNNNDLPEDVYRLPVPLSTLLSEAKEEVIANQQQQQQQQDGRNSNKYSALDQLHSLREFAWAASGHDLSNMMPVLDGLTKNEDQLGNIITKQRLS